MHSDKLVEITDPELLQAQWSYVKPSLLKRVAEWFKNLWA